MCGPVTGVCGVLAFEVGVSGAGNTSRHVEAAWIFRDG